MNTIEYGKRVVALFKSGKATKAQEAEMVEAVLSAPGNGLDNVKAIHKAIKFDEEQAEEEAEVIERHTHAMAALA